MENGNELAMPIAIIEGEFTISVPFVAMLYSDMVPSAQFAT